jgi:hypothetical protein
MDIICKVLTGSRLYHTHTDSSDWDFRGIYKPTLRECYLAQIKDVIEPANEEIYYSVQKFLDLAIKGEPVAIEILFSPLENHFSTGFDWPLIRQYRKEFLTKRMDAFLGFASSLVSKYAVKAERVNVLDNLLMNINDYMNSLGYRGNQTIEHIWASLPENDFFFKEELFYVILSRKYRKNTTLKDFRSALINIKDEYGERVRAAQQGEFDTKSVSHSFRICYQLQQIALEQDLTFPLKEAKFLREVKNKKVIFPREELFAKLDETMNETKKMLALSPLPDKVRDGIKEEILDKIYS